MGSTKDITGILDLKQILKQMPEAVGAECPLNGIQLTPDPES